MLAIKREERQFGTGDDFVSFEALGKCRDGVVAVPHGKANVGRLDNDTPMWVGSVIASFEVIARQEDDRDAGFVVEQLFKGEFPVDALVFGGSCTDSFVDVRVVPSQGIGVAVFVPSKPSDDVGVGVELCGSDALDL